MRFRSSLDSIILGGLRGVETFTFLRAWLHRASGIDGHDPRRHFAASDRGLALLVLQAGSKLNRDDVRHYVRESVDVFV
jgi:type IV secretion system protein VirB11